MPVQLASHGIPNLAEEGKHLWLCLPRVVEYEGLDVPQIMLAELFWTSRKWWRYYRVVAALPLEVLPDVGRGALEVGCHDPDRALHSPIELDRTRVT